jgi:hypothetical protein
MSKKSKIIRRKARGKKPPKEIKALSKDTRLLEQLLKVQEKLEASYIENRTLQEKLDRVESREKDIDHHLKLTQLLSVQERFETLFIAHHSSIENLKSTTKAYEEALENLRVELKSKEVALQKAQSKAIQSKAIQSKETQSKEQKRCNFFNWIELTLFKRR